MRGLIWIGLALTGFVTGWGAEGGLYADNRNLPLGVRQTVNPIFPQSLLNSGITSGWSRVALDVDATGHVTDWLVVGYTFPEFGDAAVTAIRQWEYDPMQVNGRRVPSQATITFDFQARGVVVNIHPGADLDYHRIRFGDALERVYRPRSLPELDRIPVPLAWVDPVYPKDLRERGVAGSATVEFYIDETGAVRMPAIARADFPELGDLLASAIRQWKFEPPTVHGRPVLVHASQTVTFGNTEG